MRIVVIVLLVGVCCGCLFAELCPPGWQRFGESCYFMVSEKMSWYEANRTCSEFKADLAIPKTQSHHNYLSEILEGQFSGQTPTDLWIGCNDIEKEGEWQPCPLRGQKGGFENWSKRQPDNVNGADCGTMSKSYNSKWDDKPCSKKYNPVCELPISDTSKFCLQTGPGGRVESQCLVGHVMKELRADGVVSCGKACRSEPRCRSFNLLMDQGSGKMVCQLNNATRHEVPEEVTEAKNCYLFHL